MESALRAHQRGVEGRLDEAKDRQLSLINPLRQSLNSVEAELVKIGRRLEGIQPPTGDAGADDEVAQPASDSGKVAPSEDPLAAWPDEGLPELPSGIEPTNLVKSLDLKSFYEDQRFNPNGRELAPLERLKAIEVLATGQAWMEVLQRRLQVDVGQEMETLREEGNYVEYDDGESRDPGPPGALTVGESAGDHRMRIFYLDPTSFPEVAEKQRRIEKVAEKTVRKLLQFVAE